MQLSFAFLPRQIGQSRNADFVCFEYAAASLLSGAEYHLNFQVYATQTFGGTEQKHSTVHT